jgi:RNA polymerase sigma factor (sigma-70 family)
MRRDLIPASRPLPAPVASDRLLGAVQAAQEGDAAALDEVLAYLAPPLLRAVRALLGPKNPDLEDVVQEALIAVVDALPSFRGDCTLLHFAIRIAARRATSTRRRARSVLGWLEQLARRERPLVDGPATPRDETIAERRRSLLCTLLGELPDAQSDSLVLRVALGYSIEEVAAVTRAPVNTVRSRLRLAKEALRRRIDADPRWTELWEPEA